MDENDTLGHPLPTHPAESSSAYGWRTHPQTGQRSFHYGEDYAVPEGTPISAIADSRVVFVGNQTYPRRDGSIGGAGTYFIAEVLDDGQSTGLYYSGFHASRIDVAVGDELERGDTIGSVGSTGGSTGPHLHLEVFEGGDVAVIREGRIGSSGARRFDPKDLLDQPYRSRITLREGDHNEAVAALQRDLIGRGHLAAGEDDGRFGPVTRRAVETLQRERGLSVDGIVGPETRHALTPDAPATDPPTETPAPDAPTATAFNTAGPNATTHVGDVFGGATPLGALTAEQSYALGRALFGDSQGAAALAHLDRALGTGDGVLVQRMAALGLHEGQLHAGRANPDPSRGYNGGTFQIGGIGSTPTSTAANQAELFESGVGFLHRQGFEVDRDAVTQMDRDIIVHVGYMADRTRRAFNTPLPEDQLIRDMGDAAITGEGLVHLVHNDVQGGIRDIGDTVRDWTAPRTGLGVDLAVLDARQLEPDAVRREPAMPTLDRRLHPSNYDTSRGPVTSPAVAQWQAVLRAGGFLDAEPDGIFGDQTTRATRDAQRAAGLEPDGVVGPRTWSAYSEALGQVVEGSARPRPPAGPPAPPSTESLGSVPPDEYAVRQFDGVAAAGVWDPTATRVAPSDDAARWVADTESPGDAGVQVTFPGIVADGELVARPGSTLDALLQSMAATGEAARVRTGMQVLPDGQTSTATYVLIDETTILAQYDSVDAFDADVRANGALQSAAAPDASDPGLDATRATLAANPVTADLMDQVDGLIDNLLDTHTSHPATARAALYARAQADGGVNVDSVRDVLAAQVPPITTASELEARTLASGVAVGTDLRRDHPDLAQARDRVQAADAVEAGAPNADAPPRQLDAPAVEASRVGGDGSLVGDGRGAPDLQVAPRPEPTHVER